jgi:hypothetical protein
MHGLFLLFILAFSTLMAHADTFATSPVILFAGETGAHHSQILAVSVGISNDASTYHIVMGEPGDVDVLRVMAVEEVIDPISNEPLIRFTSFPRARDFRYFVIDFFKKPGSKFVGRIALRAGTPSIDSKGQPEVEIDTNVDRTVRGTNGLLPSIYSKAAGSMLLSLEVFQELGIGTPNGTFSPEVDIFDGYDDSEAERVATREGEVTSKLEAKSKEELLKEMTKSERAKRIAKIQARKSADAALKRGKGK